MRKTVFCPQGLTVSWGARHPNKHEVKRASPRMRYAQSLEATGSTNEKLQKRSNI